MAEPSPSADRPQRKHWTQSYKVRCAWIASCFPIAACGVWYATGELIPTGLITLAMTPWLLLGGGETAHDGIKLWKGE
jgi:hypothetical protein